MMAKLLVEVGEWCVTEDSDWGEKGDVGIYADHIIGCVQEGGDEPIVLGDCCWATDDTKTDNKGKLVCFYCHQPVPPEIQALVVLRLNLDTGR